MTGCPTAVFREQRIPVIREETEITKTDYTGCNVLPEPEGKMQTAIRYINPDGESRLIPMITETLQGNVNRENPSMYIVHNYIVEGKLSFGK